MPTTTNDFDESFASANAHRHNLTIHHHEKSTPIQHDKRFIVFVCIFVTAWFCGVALGTWWLCRSRRKLALTKVEGGTLRMAHELDSVQAPKDGDGNGENVCGDSHRNTFRPPHADHAPENCPYLIAAEELRHSRARNGGRESGRYYAPAMCRNDERFHRHVDVALEGGSAGGGEDCRSVGSIGENSLHPPQGQGEEYGNCRRGASSYYTGYRNSALSGYSCSSRNAGSDTHHLDGSYHNYHRASSGDASGETSYLSDEGGVWIPATPMERLQHRTDDIRAVRKLQQGDGGAKAAGKFCFPGRDRGLTGGG
jgi:hypothetical protein